MKRYVLSVFSALCMVMLALPAFAANPLTGKSLVNGIDANYPPFAYVNEKGEPAGFDVDSMTWIANKMGFTVKHQPMDWDGIIPALLAKKIDMVCSGMSVSPERAARVTFSEPYWQVRKVFLTRQDSTLDSEQIRKGKKRLGVQRGTNEAEMVQQDQKDKGYNYSLRFYDSGPMAVEDLLNGRIDAVALDSAPAGDVIKKGKAVKIAGDFGVVDNFAVATRNVDAEIRNVINEGYKLLMADPYWEELQTKYLK